MKNGLLIWNVLLTIIAGYLLIAQVSKKGKSSGPGKDVSNPNSNSNPDNSFKIAYFEMDSVEANYLMVKDIKTELSAKEDAINTELDRLQKNYQQRFNYYQDRAKSGQMTEQESNVAKQEMENLQEQAKDIKIARDQEYGELANRRQKEVKTEIEKFLSNYNKDKKYAYIASFEQGLFYYKDTAYNITSDLVKGLNELYKPKK